MLTVREPVGVKMWIMMWRQLMLELQFTRHYVLYLVPAHSLPWLGIDYS